MVVKKVYILTEQNIECDDGDWAEEILGAFRSLEAAREYSETGLSYQLETYRERQVLILDLDNPKFSDNTTLPRL
jgi:hypothetical protein